MDNKGVGKVSPPFDHPRALIFALENLISKSYWFSQRSDLWWLDVLKLDIPPSHVVCYHPVPLSMYCYQPRLAPHTSLYSLSSPSHLIIYLYILSCWCLFSSLINYDLFCYVVCFLFGKLETGFKVGNLNVTSYYFSFFTHGLSRAQSQRFWDFCWGNVSKCNRKHASRGLFTSYTIFLSVK